MTVALQNSSPSLSEMIAVFQRFSVSERLFLAKALLDSLVLGEEQSVNGDKGVDRQTTTEDEVVVREREAFIALHPTLLQQYPNEYVAIHQGQWVDPDQDGLALSLRVHQRFQNEFVWIVPLKAQSMEEWVMRSPRFDPVVV